MKIRSAEMTDLAGIHALYAQPSCFGGTLQLPHPGLEGWRKRLEAMLADANMHCLVAESDGQILGQLSLMANARLRRRHVGDLGMAVCERARGQGVGSALLAAAVELADNWLNLRRLELEVYADNEAAIALYRRHGFEQEGLARDYAFREGRYVDALLMARLNHG
ncbi:GNAT family N-acetyltransferase [Gallaecimonas sp. GXIMD4217]|uniref:GNAT family N-acetyltransferase n=1 Tax=Gallaecimonas sp. GXIMD4217 TaxID=3131927 RepID=UPI00311ABAA6